jgi:hypothetical protein
VLIPLSEFVVVFFYIMPLAKKLISVGVEFIVGQD